MQRHPRTLAIGTFALLAVSCFGAVAWVWDGRRARDLSFEQLLDVVGSGAQPDAAIERLRARVQEGIRMIRLRREDADRTGALARNALDHIAKEANR